MKNGLSEIIKSGCAPGISTGAPALDPDSVYVKAPKGLAAIENEPKFKNGPTRSAKDISRYMGMSSDFIRKTWSKPVLVALLCVCAASLKAGDLTGGETFTDNELVHAAQLNALVNNATVNNSLISGKPVDPAILGSDTMLIYSPTLNGLYRATFNSSFLQNPALITAQSEKTVPVSGDYLLLWDSVGLTLTKVSASNLGLVFANQPQVQGSNLLAGALVPISQSGTNASVAVANLVRTIAIKNLPLTNGTMLSTNLAGYNITFPVSVFPVAVVTNAAGINFTNPATHVATYYTNGDEIPLSRFKDSSGGMAFVWGQNPAISNVFLSGTFLNGGANLTLPSRQGVPNDSGDVAGVNNTNFNVTVYISPLYITQ